MSALPIRTPTGWRQKAPSKASQLRALLSDGRWHGQQAMQSVAGVRYGARLFDLHNEISIGDGEAPLHYETKVDKSDDSRVAYRQTDKANCAMCTQEARERPTVVIERQAKEIARLRARVAELERAR